MQFSELEKAWPEDRPVEILEPACGSGGMVLAFAREMYQRDIPLGRARFTLWDVAKVACDMAYINLSLWGVAATVVWENSLSQEVHNSWTTVFLTDEVVVGETGRRDHKPDAGGLAESA